MRDEARETATIQPSEDAVESAAHEDPCRARPARGAGRGARRTRAGDEGFEVGACRERAGGLRRSTESGSRWRPGSTRRRRSRCSGSGSGDPEHDAEGTSRRLTRALADLGVEAHVVRAVVGPRVTRYELRLGSGVKVGKVRNLQQDIAYALAATEVRILAPIPGKSAVGVEVPNTRPAKVTLGDVFREYPDANDWTLARGARARTSPDGRSSSTSPRCRTCWWRGRPAAARASCSTGC